MVPFVTRLQRLVDVWKRGSMWLHTWRETCLQVALSGTLLILTATIAAAIAIRIASLVQDRVVRRVAVLDFLLVDISAELGSTDIELLDRVMRRIGIW